MTKCLCLEREVRMGVICCIAKVVTNTPEATKVPFLYHLTAWSSEIGNFNRLLQQRSHPIDEGIRKSRS